MGMRTLVKFLPFFLTSMKPLVVYCFTIEGYNVFVTMKFFPLVSMVVEESSQNLSNEGTHEFYDVTWKFFLNYSITNCYLSYYTVGSLILTYFVVGPLSFCVLVLMSPHLY